MHHSTARILLRISVFIYLAALAMCVLFQSSMAVIVVSIIYAVIIVVLFQFARCPHCKKLPGHFYWKENFCPHCGEQLD